MLRFILGFVTGAVVSTFAISYMLREEFLIEEEELARERAKNNDGMQPPYPTTAKTQQSLEEIEKQIEAELSASKDEENDPE